MLTHRTNGIAPDGYTDVVNTTGNLDYVQNGKVHRNQQTPSVMVASKDERNALTGYPPGTIAFTAGLANMWQLDVSGSWATIIEEASNDT